MCVKCFCPAPRKGAIKVPLPTSQIVNAVFQVGALYAEALANDLRGKCAILNACTESLKRKSRQSTGFSQAQGKFAMDKNREAVNKSDPHVSLSTHPPDHLIPSPAGVVAELRQTLTMPIHSYQGCRGLVNCWLIGLCQELCFKRL